MSSYRSFGWAFGVVALAAMTLMGCPDAGVLKDGLIIVDDVPGLEVASLADGAMTFNNGSSSAIQVGDIVVGTDQGGFLRRVDAVTETKGNLMETITSLASLADVIQDGILLNGFSYTTEDFVKAGLIGEDGTATLIDLSGKDIYRDYGIEVVVADGTIECVPEISLAASWDNWELTGFNMLTSGTASLNLDIEVGVDDQTPVRFETDIIPAVTHPFATSIGPIPVVGVAKLRFPIGVVGKFDGNTSVTAGFDVVDDFTIGASMEDGAWDRTFEMGTPVFTGHEPVWVIEIGADVQVYIKVVAEVTLYESASLGAYVMPYLDMDVDMYPSPMTFVLTGGINAGFSYGLSVFDYNILGDSYDWAGPSAVLYTYSAAY